MADTLTPVNIYLKLRDVFAGSILLESSDYHGHENSLSLICCESIASYIVRGEQLVVTMPDRKSIKEDLTDRGQALRKLDAFRNAFEVQGEKTKYISGGLFGYMAYDAVQHFEEIDFGRDQSDAIPEILYNVYRYVIVVDHFSNELMLYENVTDKDETSQLDRLQRIIFSNRFSTYNFKMESDESSNLTDQEYVELVKKGIHHCNRGDVFQIVLSRQFRRTFKGDE
ncbi:MAG: anthranilate synthase component I family protein, partial [Cyclobacteriaceae bacterium]